MITKCIIRRRTLLACFSFLFLWHASLAAQQPRGDAKAAGFSPDKLERIPAAIKQAVDKKQFAGASALIAKNGKIIYLTAVGMQDVEGKVPLTEATIFRIASMTKPVTSVAAMILVDDGKLSVTDPLSKFVPEFKDMKVLIPAKDGKSYETVKANREITIHDLLTHTAGITYGLMNKPIASKLYAEAGIADGLGDPAGTVGDNVKKLAKLPLVCQPGAAWEYGLNTDVLGRVVEVASGQSLEEFCRERIFQPLKMNDTGFVLPTDKQPRLATLYKTGPDKTLARDTTGTTAKHSKYYSGGAGLVSSIGDYYRFCQMMLNRGELDGVRVLKADTVDRMTQNQLGDVRGAFPGNDGFGYGFGLVSETGKAARKSAEGAGTYTWGGAYATSFWVDPKNQLVGVFMTQVFPPDFTLAQEFKRLTYEALAENEKAR